MTPIGVVSWHPLNDQALCSMVVAAERLAGRTRAVADATARAVRMLHRLRFARNCTLTVADRARVDAPRVSSASHPPPTLQIRAGARVDRRHRHRDRRRHPNWMDFVSPWARRLRKDHRLAQSIP